MAMEQVRKEANYVYWKSLAIDATGTNNSGNIEVYTNLKGSYQVIWAGLGAGSANYRIEASHDGGTTFDEVTGTADVTAGAAGSNSVEIGDMPGGIIRLAITSAGPSGTLDFYYVGKKGSNG